ncbi:hypothetical protein BN1002_03503 [Bacillus sp. B-jedd]|nr:hypothetical protein BN1002_03503 [Bacillus sp. B-jedd]
MISGIFRLVIRYKYRYFVLFFGIRVNALLKSCLVFYVSCFLGVNLLKKIYT